MFLIGKEKSILNALKQQLNAAFSMKDLGNTAHMLGMRINMAHAKALGMPLQPHVKLTRG